MALKNESEILLFDSSEKPINDVLVMDRLTDFGFSVFGNQEIGLEHKLGHVLSFLCQICFYFIDGAVLASSLNVSVRFTNINQAASWESGIYEIKIYLV